MFAYQRESTFQKIYLYYLMIECTLYIINEGPFVDADASLYWTSSIIHHSVHFFLPSHSRVLRLSVTPAAWLRIAKT